MGVSLPFLPALHILLCCGALALPEAAPHAVVSWLSPNHPAPRRLGPKPCPPSQHPPALPVHSSSFCETQPGTDRSLVPSPACRFQLHPPKNHLVVWTGTRRGTRGTLWRTWKENLWTSRFPRLETIEALGFHCPLRSVLRNQCARISASLGLRWPKENQALWDPEVVPRMTFSSFS